MNRFFSHSTSFSTLLGFAALSPSAFAQTVFDSNTNLLGINSLFSFVVDGATVTLGPGTSLSAAANTTSYVGFDTGFSVLDLNGGNVTAHNLYLGNGTTAIGNIFAGGAETVGGPQSVLTVNNDFYVGNTTEAYLDLSHNSRAVTKNTYMAHVNPVFGGASLRNGAVWTNTGVFNMGTAGTSEIEILSGSSLTTGGLATLGHSNTGLANMFVVGPDSTWNASRFYLVNGSITVESGGRLTTNSENSIGAFGGTGSASASVTVTGAGSTWESTLNTVGQIVTGSITVSDGAAWTSIWDSVGRNGNTGTVTVTGPSTTWTNTLIMVVGDSGPGFVTISDGATVNTALTGIGRITPGTAIVTGAGTSWTAERFLVGSSAGSVTVSDGASLITLGEARIGYSESYNGTVTVTGAGSSWDAPSLIVGERGTGTLTVHNGGIVRANALALNDSDGTGTLNIGAAAGDAAAAAGVIDTAVVSDTADATPGTGTGTLQFNTTGTTYFTRDGTATGTGVNTTGNIALVITAGTNIVTGSLAHTGGTTINGGTLQIGTGGTGGSISGDITNNATLRFSGSAASSVGGTISGTGSLTKDGNGTLTLNGDNSYGGTTTVSGGKLVVNGSLGSSPVFLNSGAALGGDGSFGGQVTVGAGATVSPGNSPGTMTFTEGLTLDLGSILDFELGTLSDLILVTGGVLTGPSSGTVTLNIFDSGGFVEGTYTLFDFTGATLSNFDAGDFVFGTTIPGYDYSLGFSGNTLQLTALFTGVSTNVPEPSTALLSGLGLLIILRRRRD